MNASRSVGPAYDDVLEVLDDGLHDILDGRLPDQAGRRQPVSFERYVRDNADALLRTAVFLTGNQHAGEDLLQDVLERVYRRWHRVDDPDSYLRRSLVNAASRRWRRTRRIREEDLDILTGSGREAALAGTGGDGAERFAVREQLLAALRTLAPRQRAVLVLRYFDDLSEDQTAEAVGCARGTVKTHAARGLARMREALAAAAVDEYAAAGRAVGPAAERGYSPPVPLRGTPRPGGPLARPAGGAGGRDEAR